MISSRASPVRSRTAAHRRLQGFLRPHGVVGLVQIVQINILGPQPTQTLLDAPRGGRCVRLGAEGQGAERDPRHGQRGLPQDELFPVQVPFPAGFIRE